MTEYTSSPEAIRDYMTTKERTLYWINEFASPNGKQVLSPPSIPPTIAANDDQMLGFTDDEVSEAESTRSKPPKMRLHWGDGRPDILISHWHYKDDQQRPPSTSSRTTTESVGSRRRRDKSKSQANYSPPPPLPKSVPPPDHIPTDHPKSTRSSHHSKSDNRRSSSSTKAKAVNQDSAPQNSRAASPPAVVYAPPKEGSIHYVPPIITKSKPSRSRSSTPVTPEGAESSKPRSPKRSKAAGDDDGSAHLRSPHSSRKDKSPTTPQPRPRSAGSEGTYYILPTAGQKVVVLGPDGTSVSSTTTKATKSAPALTTPKKVPAPAKPSKPSLLQRLFSFGRKTAEPSTAAPVTPAVTINVNSKAPPATVKTKDLVVSEKPTKDRASIEKKEIVNEKHSRDSRHSDQSSMTRRKLTRRPSESVHSKLRTSVDTKAK